MPSGESDRGRRPVGAVALVDVHVIATVAERGKDAWAAARRLDDALWFIADRQLPHRTICVDERKGLITIDTPTADHSAHVG